MAIASPKTKEELVRQFKFNPEVNTRLEAFIKAEPGLVQFVKELPRELLERKFLLHKMQDQQRKQRYDAKVKSWLEKPEQADLVKSLKATISPEMKLEAKVQALLNQAKNYIRNTGKAMNSDSPNLVSVRYLAARLGANVRTVWRLMAGDRNFPRPVKVGRCTRFVLSEVESYVQALLARRKTV